MKIRKTFQGGVPENKIVNTYTTTQIDAYSCDYVNDNIDKEVIISNTEPTEIDNKLWVEAGKNLLPLSAVSQTVNGIIFTVNDDKSITINGTATSDAYLVIFSGSDVILDRKFTVIRNSTNSTSSTPEILMLSNGTEYNCQNQTSHREYRTFDSGNITRIRIRVSNGETISNLTIKPMIYLGDYNSSISYEPYILPNVKAKINGEYKTIVNKYEKINSMLFIENKKIVHLQTDAWLWMVNVNTIIPNEYRPLTDVSIPVYMYNASDGKMYLARLNIKRGQNIALYYNNNGTEITSTNSSDRFMVCTSWILE